MLYRALSAFVVGSQAIDATIANSRAIRDEAIRRGLPCRRWFRSERMSPRSTRTRRARGASCSPAASSVTRPVLVPARSVAACRPIARTARRGQAWDASSARRWTAFRACATWA
jgi:hypothetical protein